jgi:hypothetical protein
MTTIASFTKPEDAHLLRMRLEAYGVSAYVQDESFVNLDMLYSNAIGGVRVQVADEDVPAATELLATDTGINDQTDSLKCPKCGSTAIENERFSRRWAYLSIALLGFPLLYFRRRFRCSDCLYTWKSAQ